VQLAASAVESTCTMQQVKIPHAEELSTLLVVVFGLERLCPISIEIMVPS